MVTIIKIPTLCSGAGGSSLHPLMLSWLVSAGISIFLPLIIFGAGRISTRRRQYYENQNDGGSGDGNGEEEFRGCYWWQFRCRRSYEYQQYQYQQQQEQQNQGDNGEEEMTTPWWWFGASSEEDRRRREENGGNSPALVFAYVWMLLLFCGIVYFGYREFQNKSDLNRVVATLVVFANFCFLTLFFLGGGDFVQTEDRELEEQGFYAQFPVMMFITCLLWTVFAGVFAYLFYSKAKRQDITKIDVEKSDYMIHDEEPDMVEQHRSPQPVSA